MPGHYMSYQQAISGDRRSPQDRNIQPARGPAGQPFSPQDMNIQPAPPPSTPFSPQDMNIPPAGGGSGGTDGDQGGPGPTPGPTPPPPPPPDDDDDDKSDLETMLTDFGTAGKKLGTSISDLMGIGPLFTVGKELAKSFNATNNFYNDLLTKGIGGMDDRDLVVYGDLLGQGIESETLIDFADKNNLDPDQRVQMGEQLRILKNEITGKDYEGIVSAYKEGQPEGFKDSVAGLFGLRDRPEGTLTRGEAVDKIGKAGMAYLDKTNPQLYDELQPYATMQGVEKLASRSLQGLSNSPEDRRYAARIMEARALAADKQSRQDANMAGSSPAFAPPTQPGTPPGTQPPAPPMQPPPGASPTPASPSGTTPTPSDYSQFPQFNMSDYARQGLGATPQFGDFNETLNRFFRFQ